MNALDDEKIEGTLHPLNGFVAIFAVRDQLGDQGIVIGRDDAVLLGMGVDPNANTAGQVQTRDPPR